MKYFLVISAVMCLLYSSCMTTPGEINKNEVKIEGEWIDLTYPFDENTIYWPTAEGFKLDTVFSGQTDGGYYYSAYSFSCAEHGGTHLDAPVHFSKGKKSVDELSIENLSGSGILIDVSDSTLQNRDYRVSQEDIENWEKKWFKIPIGSIILIRTGFGQFWPNKIQYMGTDVKGLDAVRKLHFPGLHPDAATFLIEERSIKAIGIDTPSIDFGQSSSFHSHQILFSKNIPVFENVANLDQLPETEFWLIAMPIKIKGGSGGPLRIAALIPNQ